MSVTKHYVDQQGNYLGGFQGSIPPGGIEVEIAPAHAKDTWNGAAWVPYIPPRIERLERILHNHGVAKVLLVLFNELRARGAPQTQKFAQLESLLDNEP